MMQVTANATGRVLGTAGVQVLGNNIEAYENTIPSMLSDRLRNPKFAGPANPQTGLAPEWEPVGNGMRGFACQLVPGMYLSGCEAQLIHNFAEKGTVGIVQAGVAVRSEESYDVEVWARAHHRPVTLRVELRLPGQRHPDSAQAELSVDQAHWHRRTCRIVSPGNGGAFFQINVPGDSRVVIDQIHLRPVGQTHVSRELLDAFGAFPCPVLRFPGGCVSCAYHWQHGIVPDGIIRDQSQATLAAAHFRRCGVDGLFMPHCNFGTEGAVGIIGRDTGAPVLVWGPRDEAPESDGTRLRDSHTAQALRRGLRIGHIGQRIDFFWSTIANESELLERFRVEVRPVDMVMFIRDVRQRAAAGRGAYREEVAGLRAAMTVEGMDDDQMTHVLALRDQVFALAAAHGLDAIAIQDFDGIIEAFGVYCLLANGLISERLPLAMESDIHGAISTLLVARAAGEAPAFLVDIAARHPTDNHGVLLWHCGGPLSMARPGVKPRLGRHWILPSPVSGMPHFPLRDGPITVTRFDGDRGEYRLAVGQGVSMDGPETLNNYVWMRVDDWPRWERSLIEGPWIHHTAMTYAHCADVLEEACRFVPGLPAVRLDADRQTTNGSPR